MCAISRPTKTHFIAKAVEPRHGITLQWWVVDRSALAVHAHHRDAVAAQSKEEKMIARQADQMGARGGGRGLLARIVWMNLDRATGRGWKISAVSGSDVLVEGRRPVVSPSCVRPRPVGASAHTDAKYRHAAAGEQQARMAQSWPAGVICRYQSEGTGESRAPR